MDFIFWIIIAVILYKTLMPSAPPPDGNNKIAGERHLTETQRRWREMKRDQELDKMLSVADEHATKHEQIIKLQIDMKAYILENKRPFHILVWLFDTVDSRLVGEYIRHVAIIFGIFLLIISFGGWSTLLTLVLLVNVVMIDFLLYRRQLMLEVTEWNPEFQEKFSRKFKNLIRGMDIP